MRLVGAAQNSTYIKPVPLKLRVKLNGEIDGTTVTGGPLAITDRLVGRVDGTAVINSRFSVDRAFSGRADNSTEIRTSLKQRRDSSVLPATEGVQAYAVFFPPWDFAYYDQEPGAFTTSEAEIKGLVTGTKQLGSMLQAGFVGEEVDIRWFGATDPVDDWGDGHHQVPGGYTHTYTAPGLYWMKATATTTTFVTGEGTTSEIVSANAARLIKIVNRDLLGSGGSVAEGAPVWQHTAPYDVILTTATEGAVDGAFAMQFGIRAEGNFPNDTGVGKLPTQTGVLLFIESFEDGTQLPGLRIIAGGFTTQRTMTIDPDTGFLTAIAFDPLFWLNQQIMRDQYYEDLNMLAATGLGETVTDILKDTVDNCGNHTSTTEQVPGTYDITINVPALDIALLGYVPEHYLPTLRPDMAAAHMLQHVRITIPDLPPGLMLNYLQPSAYGNLGQFANFYVAPEFSERVALGGFHSFSVGTGPVLSNVRQVLENQGAIFHSRSNLTFVLDYKPYYKDTLPSASFDIAIPDALSPVVITEGTMKNLFKVQIQKPILGLTLPNVTLPDSSDFPVNPATGQPASLNDLGVLIASRAYIQGLAGVSAAAWKEWYKQVSMPLYQAAGSPQTVDINNWNFYNDSLDPRNFLWEAQVGEPGGATLGPIQNVFTDDLNKFAIGIAREYVAHYQILLPLGNVPEIDLGDIVLITALHPAMTLDWRKKAFWVTNLRIVLDSQGLHTREVTLIEVRPKDVLIYVPDADGHPTPVPPVTQTDF
jgi:hypothetical protein